MMDRDSDAEVELQKAKETKKSKSKSKSDKHSRKDTSTRIINDSAGRSAGGFASNIDNQPTLWDLAVKATEQSHSESGSVDEQHILFVGSKDAGKTTIVYRFLDRDEPVKPTTALEYTFSRRQRGNNLDKDIGHIWELGGGTWLSKLADITITDDNIRCLSVALVVDLSKPAELWLTLERWLEVIRSRVTAVIQDSNDAVVLKEQLQQQAWTRIGSDHNDRDLIDPLLIPLVIIGSKYDIFQDFDPETRKVVSRTLRFVAHRNGADLQFFTTKIDGLVAKMKSTINHLVFNTTLSKNCQLDYNKPVLVSAGQDSFQQIGSPPLPEGDIGRVTAKTPTDLWKHSFTAKFPQLNLSDPSLVPDPAKDKQFAEAAIDTMRAQKDEELERYRRKSERRS